MGAVTRRIRKLGAIPRRVVVADDSAAMRTTLRLLLEDAAPGLDVVEAADGFGVLRALDEGPVDVLVCDLSMPVLDGRKLMRMLAERPDRPDVVIVSGAPPAPGDAWQLDTIRGWLEKPFDPRTLIALVLGAPPPSAQTGS